MKKLTVILLAITLLLIPMSVSVSAAGELNSFEQSIIDSLKAEIKNGDKIIKVPVEYINQAENFLKTIDVTESQSETIINYINLTKKHIEEAELTKTTDLKTLPVEIKRDILNNGKKAAEAVGAVLTYDGENLTVVHNGTPVFDDAPIIKVTGSNANFTSSLLLILGSVAALVAAFVVALKKGLLVK